MEYNNNNIEETIIKNFEIQENTLTEMKNYRLEKIKEYQQLLLNKFQTTKEQQYKKLNNCFMRKSQHLYNISIDVILKSSELECFYTLKDWKNKLNDLYEYEIIKINYFY